MTGDELAAKLTAARVELREAERICRMLGHAVADPAAPAAFAARLDVEVAVADRRLELWQAVVAKLEAQATPAPTSPLRWIWWADRDGRPFRSCQDCGAEVWAFREGLACSGCRRAAADS